MIIIIIIIVVVVVVVVVNMLPSIISPDVLKTPSYFVLPPW